MVLRGKGVLTGTEGYWVVKGCSQQHSERPDVAERREVRLLRPYLRRAVRRRPAPGKPATAQYQCPHAHVATQQTTLYSTARVTPSLQPSAGGRRRRPSPAAICDGHRQALEPLPATVSFARATGSVATLHRGTHLRRCGSSRGYSGPVRYCRWICLSSTHRSGPVLST